MKKAIYRITLAVCVAVFLFSAYKLVSYFLEQRNSSAGFNELREQLDSFQNSGDDDDAYRTARLAALGELRALNGDFVGWLTIEDTPIDYPVMQTSMDDPEYYLHMTFEKVYNSHGTPFASAACSISPPSDNITIYGHHMKDGSMFASLVKYADQSYFNAHPVIIFDTLYDLGTYEIVAALKTQVYTDSPDEFRYYEYVDFADEAEFSEFYDRVKSMALYDTGVTAAFGDKLITLSTCEYTSANGRMVIVAKKVA